PLRSNRDLQARRPEFFEGSRSRAEVNPVLRKEQSMSRREPVSALRRSSMRCEVPGELLLWRMGSHRLVPLCCDTYSLRWIIWTPSPQRHPFDFVEQDFPVSESIEMPNTSVLNASGSASLN